MTDAPMIRPDAIAEIVTQAGLEIVERHTVPGRVASNRAIPSGLHASLWKTLARQYPQGLYAHQALAIEYALAGRDVCLATPTASGKSLAFMSAAAHAVLSDPSARVLALYPMKALIRDQLSKWKTFLRPYGVAVGYIDGSVPVNQRDAILGSSRIVAMTPDVAHAWLVSHPVDGEIGPFLQALRLLVLDEAHVYDGVFGTNMAYFLRRLAVVAAPYHIICSTATVGEAEAFMEKLTGRQMMLLGTEADGSQGFDKTLLLARVTSKAFFEAAVTLLVAIARQTSARFLAFADSRKAVELITAATHRRTKDDQEEDHPRENLKPGLDRALARRILPYRAGYEEEDRHRIQHALGDGNLSGVVSTNALELGLDIGDLDVVVLLNTPPTTKAFHQRIGRAGRRRPAVCVVIDDLAHVDSLPAYLARKPEPGWVYLENRYIQYTHALCAAAELHAVGASEARKPEYGGLPESFLRFVENELWPGHGVDDDLFPLKQQGRGNPHHEFPVRHAAEQGFTIIGPNGAKLGTVSHAQLLREAYPGAVYYYLARPYRVLYVDQKRHEIRAKRDGFTTTQPATQATVFADFRRGLLQGQRSPAGFVAEVDLQVSERVVGFTEVHGKNRTAHQYGTDSSFSRQPLARYFRTTGVCWAFPAKVARSEVLALRVMQAFCEACGVLERDVGSGLFQANEGPFGSGAVEGMVVYDATVGSLRLTQRLVDRFGEVIAAAIERDNAASPVMPELAELAARIGELGPAEGAARVEAVTTEGDCVDVVAAGEPGMLVDGTHGAQEVTVAGYRHTPQGLMYELVHDKPGKWMVMARRVRALPGITRTVRVNAVTGEEVQTAA